MVKVMAMFPQKEKSKDKEKILSEKEIQKKLYGGFYHGQVGGTVKTESPAQKEAAGDFAPKTEPKHQGLFDAPESPFDKQTARPKDSIPESQSPAAELFKKSPDGIGRPAPDLSVYKSNKPKDSFQASSTQNNLQAPKQGYPFPSTNRQLAFGDGLSDKFFSVWKALGSVLGALLILVDLRNPVVRKIFYWVTGVVCLVALFLGTHQLNVNRELAIRQMKGGKASEQKISSSVKSASDKFEKKDVKKTASSKDAAKIVATAPLAEKTNPDESSQEEKLPAGGVAESDANEKAATAPAKTDAITDEAEANPYVIQIATYATQEDAERVVEDLNREGMKAFSKDLSRSSGRTYYCVFIGRFKDTADAYSELSNFRKKTISKSFTDAFVRALS